MVQANQHAPNRTGHVPHSSTGHVPLPRGKRLGEYPAMPLRTNRAIVHRIHQRLKAVGKSARKASLEAKLGADVIRDLQRSPEVMPRLDTIEALAPTLGATPEWLAFGVTGGRAQRPGTLKIIGEVAAGLWLDIEGPADHDQYEQVPVPAHPAYPEEAQYGLIVRGTSINRIANPGDVLQCVDLGITGLAPIDDDVVIVERRRAQHGQKEVTAKRWRLRGTMIELAPDSDDPRWSDPLLFDPRRRPENDEIAVIALVIGVYKPLRRR